MIRAWVINSHFRKIIFYTKIKSFQIIFKVFKGFQTAMDLNPVAKVDLGGMRAPYDPEGVERDFSIKDPIALFDSWFNIARNTESIKEANAMAVATADKFGKPSVRYVLLKSYSKEGFIFFTNYNSQKGREIAENPHVSLLFYWEALCRQVRVVGSAVKISCEDSEVYFHSRPRNSQLSAAVSAQSEVIENKEILLKKKEMLEEKYNESTVIPKPNCWGGYLVVPESIEFFCGRSDRLHDRMRFRRLADGEKVGENCIHPALNGWVYEFLSP